MSGPFLFTISKGYCILLVMKQVQAYKDTSCVEGVKALITQWWLLEALILPDVFHDDRTSFN